jgi:hypothetical protein
MKNFLSKFYCFFHGHDFLLVYSEDNGRSQFKQYKCTRCSQEEEYQYDYGSW